MISHEQHSRQLVSHWHIHHVNQLITGSGDHHLSKWQSYGPRGDPSKLAKLRAREVEQVAKGILASGVPTIKGIYIYIQHKWQKESYLVACLPLKEYIYIYRRSREIFLINPPFGGFETFQTTATPPNYIRNKSFILFLKINF